MKRIKRRIFAGTVCEQIVYSVSDRVKDIQKAAPPKQRFKTPEERELHKTEISRRRHARLFNENFGPTSLFSTLTFDDEHEVHTYDEAKKILDNYVRRLMYAHPEAVIFAYKGRGATHRIHIHMVSQGVPQELIEKQWPYGKIKRIENLREHNFYDGVDHGQDYTALANYLFNHWTPEQGGHRWKQTRTARKPDIEPATEAIRNYSVERPPTPPKGYMLVDAKETKYGYLYFKYVKKPQRKPPGRKKKPIPNRLS